MTYRTTLNNLLSELRGMCEANSTEYTINNTDYWSNEQLQDILDNYRVDAIFEQLQMYPTQVAAGSLSYKDYRSIRGFYEATDGGTAIFYLQDSTGATVGTSNYSVDYRRGVVTFNSDQRGTVYYLTGSSYDLRGAASEVWRRKAAHYAPTSFNFSTDNHSINRAQVYEHCKEMADYFESKSTDSIQSIPTFRSDLC